MGELSRERFGRGEDMPEYMTTSGSSSGDLEILMDHPGGARSGRCFYGEYLRCGPRARRRPSSMLSEGMPGQIIFSSAFLRV
jgi:hypothetical protein